MNVSDKLTWKEMLNNEFVVCGCVLPLCTLVCIFFFKFYS